MKFCIHCGAQLEDSANFCTSCGKNPNPAEAVPQPEAAPQPTPAQEPTPTPQPVYTAPQTVYTAPQPQRTLVFGKLAFIFGLIGLIWNGVWGIIGFCTVGTLSSMISIGLSLSIAGLVMGIIGKRKNPDDPKAKTGFTLSLVGIIVGFVCLFIGIAICTCAVANLSALSGYYY